MNKSLLKLIAVNVFLASSFTGVRLAAPLNALTDGYGTASLGFLLALFALSQVFLALPAGRYCDRHGLKRPVLYAVIATTVGTGLAAVYPHYPALCLAAILTGGANGAVFICLQRHLGRAATNSAELKTVFSWFSVGPALANFMGPLAAGLLIDYVGYRWTFVVLALLPLISWWCVRDAIELPPVPPEPDAADQKAWHLLRRPMFRKLMLVNWLISGSWDVHTLAVPIFAHERGLSASQIGVIFGAFATAVTVVRMAVPAMSSRLREDTVMTASLLIATVSFALYPFQSTALGMGLVSVLLGCGLGVAQPMIMSTLHQVTPESRHGEALGLRMMFVNASSVAMPMLFGALGTAVGISAMFWATSVVVVSGTRMALQLKLKD